MRYASVCDGIGAVHVAWQPLGWHCEWTAEIDAFPAAVVEQRWGFPNRGDMTRFRDWGDLDVDLLVGGTPCQAFSVAGLRRSLEDERGNLSLVFVNLMDAIDEERKRVGKPPAICVWENVPGVLSTKDNAFGCFLAGLAGEGVPLQPSGGKWSNAGYVLGPKRAVAWRVLDAQYFGVAQRRRRVFLVASARDGFSPAAVLFEPEGLRRDHAPSRAKGQGTPAAASSGTGCGGEPIWRGGDQANSEHCHGHAGTLNCDKGQQGGIVAIRTAQTSANGHGIANDVAHTLDQVQGQAVAFTKAKRAQSTTDDESWVPGEVAPTCNCFDQGDTRATTVVAYDVHGTLAKKGASETDVHTALRSRSPGQSEASTTTVVAFTQNTRDEVRQINGDGQIAGALSAEAGMHQTNYIAFANRTRDGIKVPEVMKDGVTPALTNPGDGGRSDAVNVLVPMPVAFAQNQLGEVRTNSEVMGTVNTNQNASGRNTPMVMQGVAVDFQNCAMTADVCGTLMGEAQKKGGEAGHGVWTPMAVRRLTPRECERLQGFPDDYTAIEYRKKPAADGPRYKALGNSMAVPVMAWIGQRIAKCATH